MLANDNCSVDGCSFLMECTFTNDRISLTFYPHDLAQSTYKTFPLHYTYVGIYLWTPLFTMDAGRSRASLVAYKMPTGLQSIGSHR